MIIYKGRDEVIVCEDEAEQACLETYFTNGGRDVDEYDRLIPVENVVMVSFRPHVDARTHETDEYLPRRRSNLQT